MEENSKTYCTRKTLSNHYNVEEMIVSYVLAMEKGTAQRKTSHTEYNVQRIVKRKIYTQVKLRTMDTLEAKSISTNTSVMIRIRSYSNTVKHITKGDEWHSKWTLLELSTMMQPKGRYQKA